MYQVLVEIFSNLIDFPKKGPFDTSYRLDLDRILSYNL